MKQQIVTVGLVLARTEFQEADRIITILTPDHGKVRLIAKGVRRERSKLAGGIELFSVSHLTFLQGRKEIGTLVSSRLIKHYENIVKDINRTMLGYELLKRINRTTEDAAGEEYYNLLVAMLEGLDDQGLESELAELWFTMQLLKISGHSPRLQNDVSGNELKADKNYLFSYEDMAFRPAASGPFTTKHVKLMRLAMGLIEPMPLKQVKDAGKYQLSALQLAKTMLSRFVRV